MIGPKLSFRIYDNSRGSTKMESRGGTIKDSIRQLDNVCRNKYGITIRDCLDDKPQRVRTRHRRKNEPLEMFYDSPDKVRRIRRRRGEI